ncbi:hypothetical protein K493DRAFT_298839 [Basidiobolus meristosporus CBS 931.73]|uniref:Protein YAE1 n=1 Tax=Basidiobolus meristosporus CBS 931.73 TaxID=1314790 RepID=A0A1Y1YR72_9FUNG|nr:hypothetical protein K493DRAFT_298839 [Basidiobolus meristosporus CBS 931.73]|eukprot:ORY00479.1 hypothetical protein K493DRAFT_298839 [Basidiobolus meristosporus CBS 931.73]
MGVHEKDDDIWASDCSDNDFERQMADREWSRLNENFGNEGYKEGLSEGKDQTMEDHFGDGFTEGGRYGIRMGELRGWVSAILVSAEALQVESNKKEELKKLEEELRWYKSEKMFSTRYFRPSKAAASSEEQKSSNCCQEASDSACCQGEQGNCSSEPEGNSNKTPSSCSQDVSPATLDMLPENIPYADKFQDKMPAEIVREYEEKVTKIISSLGLNISL